MEEQAEKGELATLVSEIDQCQNTRSPDQKSPESASSSQSVSRKGRFVATAGAPAVGTLIRRSRPSQSIRNGSAKATR